MPKEKCQEKVYLFIMLGGFAKCYEGVDIENNKRYAIKVMEKASLQKSRAKQKVMT